MNFKKIKNIYMIGIKGVGMAALAQYFVRQGIIVSGSDVKEKFMTDEPLKRSGIKILLGFTTENISTDADLIIYSTAYNIKNNPEVARAIKSKINTITYAEALANIFNSKYGVAVIGSHGKTTTTAWLGYVSSQAGLDPTVMVGASVPQFNGLGLAGKSAYLIAEIDEYQNKLKYFQPKSVLLNNIDYDHPDFFPSIDDYKNVFIEFIKKIPAKGFLVANFDDPIIRKIARVNCRGKVITYAINEAADYVAYDIKSVAGQQYFKVKLGIEDGDDGVLANKELGSFVISLFGEHNISNALAIIAISLELGLPLSSVREYLGGFKGTVRRMQVLGNFRGTQIIDDYAHHPTEIKASLSAAREMYGDKKIIVVFHPHTFTRTKAFLDDFAGSFSKADEIIILGIYGSAREKQGGINGQDLVDKIKIKDNKAQVRYIETLDQAEKYLRGHIERNEVVVLMGAGDVFRIGENLLN